MHAMAGHAEANRALKKRNDWFRFVKTRAHTTPNRTEPYQTPARLTGPDLPSPYISIMLRKL